MLDGKWGFINRSGEIVIAAQYDNAYSFSKDGMARVMKDSLWGYINNQGNIVGGIQYRYAFPFQEKHAIVVVDSSVKLGVIDIDGRLTLLPGHVDPKRFNQIVFGNGYNYKFKDSVVSVNDGFYLTNMKDTIGYYSREVYYNYKGEIIGWGSDFHWRRTDSIQYKDTVEHFLQNEKKCYGEKRYQFVSYPSEGLMRIKKDDKWGYINIQGDIVIKPCWDECAFFHEGIACVKQGDKWGAINRDGKIVIGIEYDKLQNYSEGFASAEKNGKWGVIDKKGKVVIPFKWDWVDEFKDGLATINLNKKYGVINVMGDVVVRPSYDFVLHYPDSIFIVTSGDKHGAIDGNGNIIIPAENYGICPSGCRTISVLKEAGRKGLTDYKGNWIIPDDEKWIDTYECGELLLAIVDDKWYYINKEGKIVWRDESVDISKPKSPEDFGIDNIYLVEFYKENYKRYFTSLEHNADLIEGLYYVYGKNITKNNYSGQEKVISCQPEYWAILGVIMKEGPVFLQCCRCQNDLIHPMYVFEKIGNTNAYNIRGFGLSAEGGGKIIIDNPLRLTFCVEYGHNDHYTGYFEYELIRDFPTADMLESINQSEWSGSGFAIGNGYIATNYHIANGAKRIMIVNNDEDATLRYNAQVVAYDDKNDLAILKIIDSKFEGIEDIPYAFNTSLADAGEDVFVLGYPMTSTMGEEIKLTTGVISSTKGYQDNKALYQISTPIQPGNSGGPLFDSNGDIIGVVCAKHKDAENAGYAVKMLYLDNLIKKYNLPIALSKDSDIHSKSLSKKVKKVKGFVFKIECSN